MILADAVRVTAHVPAFIGYKKTHDMNANLLKVSRLLSVTAFCREARRRVDKPSERNKKNTFERLEYFVRF